MLCSLSLGNPTLDIKDTVHEVEVESHLPHAPAMSFDLVHIAPACLRDYGESLSDGHECNRLKD